MRDGQPRQTAPVAAAHRAIHQELEGGAIFGCQPKLAGQQR